MALVDPQRLFLEFTKLFINADLHLTAVFFETGAMSTPTKSRNVTNVVQGVHFNHN